MGNDDAVARVVASLPPYALALGIGVERIDGAAPLLTLDFSEKVHGRPGFRLNQLIKFEVLLNN